MKFRRRHIISLILLVLDFLCAILAYYVALWIRFEGEIPAEYLSPYLEHCLFFAVASTFIYYCCNIYNRFWGKAGIQEIPICLWAPSVAVIVQYLVFCLRGINMPRTYWYIGGQLQIFLLIATRYSRRVQLYLWNRYCKHRGEIRQNAMLIGAGSAGMIFLNDLSTSLACNLDFKCIIDDDSNKWDCIINGLPIIGGKEKIKEAVKKYKIKRIFIAIPSATHDQLYEILNECNDTGCAVRTLPGLFEFSTQNNILKRMSDLRKENLLRPSNVHVNQDEIEAGLQGKVILITGAAGAVGSELTRQIIRYSPKRLILIDSNENRLSFLQETLNQPINASLDHYEILASVLDAQRLDNIFQAYRPDIVIHTAAYKNVVLTEQASHDTVRNNVIGTCNVAALSQRYNASRFILLSTDKADKPSSIFGASSRLCEILIQVAQTLQENGTPERFPVPLGFPKKNIPQAASKTTFSTICFGNVLGDEGSFLHRLQTQLEEGGPLKIASKDTTRYCMNLKDMVPLLLQAIQYTQKGGFFLLDFGKPYNLHDLAFRLIENYGLIPQVEIKIQYTGQHPGEKVQEEPMPPHQELIATANPLIFKTKPESLDLQQFLNNFSAFLRNIDDPLLASQDALSDLVPSYCPGNSGKVILAIPDSLIRSIVGQFQVEGVYKARKQLTDGYINYSYCITTVTEDRKEYKYLLQRINQNAFHEPEKLMENFSRATKHLAQSFHLAGGPDSPATQTLIPTVQNKTFLADASGNWRMLTYFDNVKTCKAPAPVDVFYQAGRAFASFLKALNDNSLAVDSFHYVIKDFHNTPTYYKCLQNAREQDVVKRVALVKPELDFLASHDWLYGKIADPLAKGEIPQRLCHNDTNLNNILFDDKSFEPVAIIDLDTIMPSTPLYDFGDSMRIGTNPAADDEKDLSRVYCDLALYESYARGWLEVYGPCLSQSEKELLPFASLVVTSEDAIRFLTDFLENDKYYATSYQGQNLDRARTQIKLLKDMEDKLPKIREILAKLFLQTN